MLYFVIMLTISLFVLWLFSSLQVWPFCYLHQLLFIFEGFIVILYLIFFILIFLSPHYVKISLYYYLQFTRASYRSAIDSIST
jgi:hypothetical protein